MFLSSIHILHVTPNLDQIFRATTPYYDESSSQPYYYNSDPRARPLACIDTSELCSPDGKHCWSMKSAAPKSAAFMLTELSLASSTIYDSIKSRLATALLAQESVGQYVSGPLDPRQWEVEAAQLFATSLARIQYDAWGIATAEDRERPGYVEDSPEWARGQLCDIYKFKIGVGYTNVNIIAYICIVFAAGAVWILSWKANRQEGEDDEAAYGQPLVVDVVGIFAGRAVLWAAHGAFWSVLWLCHTAEGWFQAGRETFKRNATKNP
jgi:hypothetical protein